MTIFLDAAQSRIVREQHLSLATAPIISSRTAKWQSLIGISRKQRYSSSG